MIPRVVMLTLYLRVFTEKGYRVACYILMWLVIALGVADILTGALECIPVEYLWDKSIPGHCIDLPLFFRWGTLPNGIMDFFMLILPQPVIWKLQVNVQVKIGLAVTILTGSVYESHPPTFVYYCRGYSKLTLSTGVLLNLVFTCLLPVYRVIGH